VACMLGNVEAAAALLAAGADPDARTQPLFKPHYYRNSSRNGADHSTGLTPLEVCCVMADGDGPELAW